MSSILELEPKTIWDEFFEMCKVPHGSGNCDGILKHLEARAAVHGLESKIEEVSGNILIIKKADPGYENAPVICLQGHMDMVCAARAGSAHDFLKDPIVPRMSECGKRVTATGTSLGADDGIGVATALAIAIDKTIKTGRIEILVTRDEETTMEGMKLLGSDLLSCKYFLNLDSEDLGVITIGSAGGCSVHVKLAANVETAKDCHCVSISVSNLSGGHSGVDINLGRLNAIRAVARLLRNAHKYGGCLCSIKASYPDNAIPMDCSACICFDGSDKIDEFIAEATHDAEGLKIEHKTTDPKFTYKIERKEKCSCCSGCVHATLEDSKRMISFLNFAPAGVMRMSAEMEGIVETSMSNGNISWCAKDPQNGLLTFLIRSSQNTALIPTAENVILAAEACGYAHNGIEGVYGGWAPNPKSPLLKLCAESYKKIMGTDPKIEAIHAGLEVGECMKKYPDIDGISIGPTIKHPHSDNEFVEIESVKIFYEVLKDLIAQIYN